MRLGLYPARLTAGTKAAAAYGTEVIYERHRHRFEVNNQYREALEAAGMVISGQSPDGRLVEIVELRDHPWFVASQFHPEFKSRPDRPHPLFQGFVRAAMSGAVASRAGHRGRRRRDDPAARPGRDGRARPLNHTARGAGRILAATLRSRRGSLSLHRRCRAGGRTARRRRVRPGHTTSTATTANDCATAVVRRPRGGRWSAPIGQAHDRATACCFAAGCRWEGPCCCRLVGHRPAPITVAAYGEGRRPVIEDSFQDVLVTGDWFVIQDLHVRADPPTRDARCDRQPAGVRYGIFVDKRQRARRHPEHPRHGAVHGRAHRSRREPPPDHRQRLPATTT